MRWYAEVLGLSVRHVEEEDQFGIVAFPEGNMGLALFGEPDEVVSGFPNRCYPVVIVDDLDRFPCWGRAVRPARCLPAQEAPVAVPDPMETACPKEFRGPYADGPPAAALAVDAPPLEGFGWAELRRAVVVVAGVVVSGP